MVGYVIGGVMVAIGLAGGIYGQLLRRRGRRNAAKEPEQGSEH
ncbi:MAG: hypothetical protein JWN80_863 [Microbacteriaceae bacterium]|jgi:hypothetical protein|nr:hypothetical protein [Microbacteriaceae bacterium]